MPAQSSADPNLQQLVRRNEALERQLESQQAMLEELRQAVTELRSRATPPPIIHDLPEPTGDTAAGAVLGKINLSGEAGAGLFHTGSEGAFPNSEFRVDEAKLFLEGPLGGKVYFFTEINLAAREARDLTLSLGECYVDFENLSRFWERDRQLNLRLGRLDIPFGEEYLNRDVIDNPLISRSLSDLWGVDEGLEIYGEVGRFAYVLAVQNGGTPTTRDFDRDKSVAGRLTFNAANWLRISGSGMRTGDIDAASDQLSELWFGGGWIRSIGGAATHFEATSFEGDVEARWRTGHLRTFGGHIRYTDNDSPRANERSMFYYSIEGVQNLNKRLFVGARFSQILAPGGYPITGYGTMGEYFFSPVLTDQIWRLSLGIGYWWTENLLAKTEYSFERGSTTSGASRDEEDFFGFELAFRF